MNPAARTRVRWHLIAWFFVLSAVAFLDRVNISIAGGSLAQTYGLSNEQLGWVFSSFLIGYALFQTPGGRLADKLGPRRVLAAAVIWWGVFTCATALVPESAWAFWLLIAVRFLLGTGEAVMYPASNQFVARWIPVEERGIANGWIFAGVGAGAGLSPPLITYVMLRFGWRSSFWVCAVLGLIVGFIWYIVARDTPQEHKRVSPAELEFIRQGLSARESDTKNPRLIAWWDIIKSREVLAVTLSYFAFGYVAWIFFSWFFIYLAQARHLNLKASAFYAMLPFLAMAAACAIGGIISDRLTRAYGDKLGRSYLAAIAMALTSVFLVFGAKVHSGQLASVVLAGGAGALYLSQSSFWSVSAGLAESSSGSVSGFMNMGAQVGGAVTAELTPAIAGRFGWTAAFVVAAGLCVLGALSWIVVDPRRAIANRS